MAMTGRTVFRTPWFQIATMDPGQEAGGSTDPYYCILRQNGVIGMVFDDAGRVVLVDQYRPPLDRRTLEMPAGGIEEGETPEEAIAREVLEETGFVCQSWVQVGPCRVMPNRENVIEYFYIGLRGRRLGTDGSESG